MCPYCGSNKFGETRQRDETLDAWAFDQDYANLCLACNQWSVFTYADKTQSPLVDPSDPTSEIA